MHTYSHHITPDFHSVEPSVKIDDEKHSLFLCNAVVGAARVASRLAPSYARRSQQRRLVLMLRPHLAGPVQRAARGYLEGRAAVDGE